MERTGSPTLPPRPTLTSTGSRLVDRIEHLEGGCVLGCIVHPEHRRPARERREVGGERWDEPVVHPGAEQIAEQALAGNADQDRQAELRAQARGRLERLEVLNLVLAKTDA